MRPLLIYGSSEFGQVIRDLAFVCGYPVAGFVDDFNEGSEILGTFEKICSSHKCFDYDMALAIGYNNLGARWNVYKKVCAAGYSFPKLVHPHAYVRNLKNIGQGTFVMAGAIIDANAVLNDLVVAWPGVVVNHDSIVGENTFLSPNCTICGSVNIGANCFVGAGATIVDHVTVPNDFFIKAGALYKKKRGDD